MHTRSIQLSGSIKRKVVDKPFINKTLLKITREHFIRDLNQCFFFGERAEGPKNFFDIFKKFTSEKIYDIKQEFKTLTLEMMKLELENIIKDLEYSYRISYKRWYCGCNYNKQHHFPERICGHCGVGIILNDSNFGILFPRR